METVLGQLGRRLTRRRGGARVGSTTSGEKRSRGDQRWALFIGGLLLVNAGLIAFGFEGRVEAYVGSGICAVGGVLTLASGLLPGPRRIERSDEPVRGMPSHVGRDR